MVAAVVTYHWDGEYSLEPEPFVEPPRILLWAFVIGCALGVLLPFPTVWL